VTPAEIEALIASDPVLTSVSATVRKRLADAPHDAAHDYRHALRVASWTLRIVGPEAPARLALLAALLHDVVNVPKSSPERARASELSAAFAREILTQAGLPPDDIAAVADAITDHSFSRGAVPRSLLGRALQDADRLEAVGALGLLRCVSTGVSLRADYFHPEDPWAQRRTLDDRAYSVDHFFTKLLGLADTMQTDVGRREAERRTQFLREFLRELGSEIDDPPPHLEKKR
jgi:uncharacterized protein